MALNRCRLLGKLAENGMSQNVLASVIGISPNSMSAKINGKSSFNLVQVEKICAALHIDNMDERADIFLSETSH